MNSKSYLVVVAVVKPLPQKLGLYMMAVSICLFCRLKCVLVGHWPDLTSSASGCSGAGPCRTRVSQISPPLWKTLPRHSEIYASGGTHKCATLVWAVITKLTNVHRHMRWHMLNKWWSLRSWDIVNTDYCRSWWPSVTLAVWLGGNVLVSINVVTLHQARLVPGWVTALGQVIIIIIIIERILFTCR